MKRVIYKSSFVRGAVALCLMLGAAGSFQSCTETIDDSNYAIKTEQTMSDFIEADEDFSDMKAIFDRVRLSSSEDASVLTSVLSARGNYTCFIAPNDVVRAYVKSLIGTEDVSQLSYEQAQLIAYNCIIDNADNSAYESPDFPMSGAFSLPALSNRLLNCEFSSEENAYIINGSAMVVNADNEVSNGMVHVVDHVIAPSQNTVADLIIEAGNLRVMGELMKATTWCDSLVLDRDSEYDDLELEETRTLQSVGTFNVVDSRYQGYTVFTETDEVFTAWGIPAPVVDESTGNVTNSAAILSALESKCAAYYGSEQLGNYEHPDNPVNKFVAYHILPAKIAFNRFVHHFNEHLYQYGDAKEPREDHYTVNVWDYYTTMGKHRGLLKITQVATGDYDLYINRISTYENEPGDHYKELSYEQGEGLSVRVNARNGEYDNNARNGYYYPIDAVLLYKDDVRRRLGSERIRIDLTTMLPEMASNNLRGTNFHAVPNGYFNNITNESSDTRIFYLQDGFSKVGNGWHDYQGDEYIFAGLFDFVLKLPPVPVNGTYEIRMGCAQNPWRGMGQIYMGDDPQNLMPVGLPYDMRQSASNNPAIPWVADGDDETVNRENDRNLRNQGYMKAPNYFSAGTGSETAQSCREFGGSWPCLRRIVTVAQMEANKTYYLRFKSALEDREAQFFVDYFEFVPSSVYNGSDSEDIW